MGIIKDKLNEQIDQKGKLQFNDTTGTILAYNEITNTATVRFKNPNGEGTFRRENVPIANSLGGLCGSGIQVGQQCSISFRANNVYAPVITGVLTNFYQEKTSKDQGACLVDESILSVEKPTTILPMSAEWLDEDNQDPTKYLNAYSNYADDNVDTKIYNLIRTLDKYSNKEQGITNLSTKSTVKLKENGDIDIFVANNIGIRVSPKDNSISLYGKLKINGKVIDLEQILNDMLSKE